MCAIKLKIPGNFSHLISSIGWEKKNLQYDPMHYKNVDKYVARRWIETWVWKVSAAGVCVYVGELSPGVFLVCVCVGVCVTKGSLEVPVESSEPIKINDFPCWAWALFLSITAHQHELRLSCLSLSHMHKTHTHKHTCVRACEHTQSFKDSWKSVRRNDWKYS